MRLHIELDDSVVAEVDERAGTRRRSEFIRGAILAALEQSRRWELIKSAPGAISEEGHDWDADPAQWVHDQRHSDPRFTG